MRRRIPIQVVLCVTNRCNLRCVYCYEEYYDRNYKEFTTEQILSLIDELCDMGTKLISINGGEALVRDDIEVIVDKINKKNILCQLTTNGLLVKKNIPVLKKVDSLTLSIDGYGESNDLNRGRGTYEKIIEAFECLNENHIKFHSHTVLTKNNKNAVDEILTLASKYKFQTRFSPLRIADSPDKTIGLNDEEVTEIIGKIIRYKKQGRPIFFSEKPYENLLNWPFSYDKQYVYEELPGGFKQIECFIKRFSCHIEANGLVYPCIVLVNKFKALNFLEAGFKKAWENLADNKCRACNNICCNDLNLTFGFKPNAAWKALKIVVNRIRGRLV